MLRTLQYFPLPEGTQAQRQLHDTLVAIFNREWSGVGSHSSCLVVALLRVM